MVPARYSLTHLLTHSLTPYSLTHSLTHLLTYLLTHLLGLKKVTELGAPKARRRAKKAATTTSDAAQEEGAESAAESEEEDEEDEEDDEDMLNEDVNSKFFGYIDDSGNVVYMALDSADGEGVDEVPAATTETSKVVESLDALSLAPTETVPANPPLPPARNDVASVTVTSAPVSDTKAATVVSPDGSATSDAKPSTTNFSSYFVGRTNPAPRINASIMVRGNILFVYGGVTELGDVEVTLDDCWCFDLSKRDVWRNILAGSMHQLVWKGEDLEGTDGTRTDSDEDGEGGDDDEDEDGNDDEDDEEGEDNEVEAKGSAKSPERSGRRREGGRMVGGGVRDELEEFRAKYDMDIERSPLGKESLREFYARTNDYWSNLVIERWNASDSKDTAQPLSEKDIKREGFKLAEARYNELLPVLARLSELESEQSSMEELSPDALGARGGGKAVTGGSARKASGKRR